MLKTVLEGVFLVATVVGLGAAGINIANKLETNPPRLTYHSLDMEVPLNRASSPTALPSPAVSPKAVVEPVETEHLMLDKTNTILLRGEINDSSVSEVMTKAFKLNLIESSSSPIYLVLKSPGGSIMAGMDMIQALKGLRRPVHTVTIMSASMAFQTVQQMGTRYVLDTGVLMSHRAMGGMSGEIGGRQPSSIRNRIGLIEDIMNKFDEDTVARTNGKQTMESYQTSYTAELWLLGARAVREGYADKLAVLSCSSNMGKETKVLKTALFGDVTLSFSECPLDSNVSVAGSDKGPLSYEQIQQIKETFYESESVNSTLTSLKL